MSDKLIKMYVSTSNRPFSKITNISYIIQLFYVNFVICMQMYLLPWQKEK